MYRVIGVGELNVAFEPDEPPRAGRIVFGTRRMSISDGLPVLLTDDDSDPSVVFWRPRRRRRCV